MAYDVFISFKNTAPGGGLTVDRTIAERLHMKLRDEGLEVFFSEKDLSNAAFMDQIYQALDEADLLILVGTSAEYINSRWVKSEWSTFFGSIQSGRKENGHIITVLHGITTRDLPIQLEHFESFGANDLDNAVDFAFRTLGKVKKSEAAARIAEEQERQRKAAEEAAVLEMQKRMEAERQAEKERAAAEKKRQKALAAAERERQRRINAEKRAAEAQERSKKQAGQNRWLKIAAAVMAVALVVGGAVGVGVYVKQQEELERIAEEQEIAGEYSFALTEDGKGYVITKYSGNGGDVVIPETYKGKPVVRIGDEAFVQGLGFSSKITSIAIPDSVTSIGEKTFMNCSKLALIDIPDSVTSIGNQAFANCSGLTSIAIPDSVTSIGSNAFAKCSGLTSITIPDSMTGIGDEAFANCTGLTSITISDGVTSIGSGAFANCSNLTSIDIPDSVTKMGQSAFRQCRKLTSINISSNNPKYRSDGVVIFSKDGKYVFTCSDGFAGSYAIPDGVTIIGAYAFEACKSLKSITIPDSVTQISGSAFLYCDNLKSVSIPESVVSIGASAFAYCYSLESVIIPEGVTNIGASAFYQCRLTSVTIPDSVTSIGYGAFPGSTVRAPHEPSYYGFQPDDGAAWVVE